jgi:hypothetical protein
VERSKEMGLLNLPKGLNWGTGLAIGAASVLLAPIVLPVLGGIVKSLTKAGIKGGMVLYEKGRLLAEETKETIEDLTEEAKAELGEEQMAVAKPKKAAAK